MATKDQHHSKERSRSKRAPDKAAQVYERPEEQESTLPDAVQRARMNPGSLTGSDVRKLQRTIGNKAVVQLMASPQAAARVRPPRGEGARAPGRSAGSMAIKNRSTATPIIQRAPRTPVQTLVKQTDPNDLNAMGVSAQARTFLGKLNTAAAPWRVYDDDAFNNPAFIEEAFNTAVQGRDADQENKPLRGVMLAGAGNEWANHTAVTESFKGYVLGVLSTATDQRKKNVEDQVNASVKAADGQWFDDRVVTPLTAPIAGDDEKATASQLLWQAKDGSKIVREIQSLDGAGADLRQSMLAFLIAKYAGVALNDANKDREERPSKLTYVKIHKDNVPMTVPEIVAATNGVNAAELAPGGKYDVCIRGYAGSPLMPLHGHLGVGNHVHRLIPHVNVDVDNVKGEVLPAAGQQQAAQIGATFANAQNQTLWNEFLGKVK